LEACAQTAPTPTKPPHTVLDGIYSAAQAQRGASVFATSCASCHKADLTGFSGPPLKGAIFLDRWREFPARVLFDEMRLTMPKDAQAPLPEAAYLDVFSFLLRENEIPPGRGDLKFADLEGSLLVGKDGPQPLPNASPAGVVGCLHLEVGTGWFIVSGAEPHRVVDAFDLTDKDIQDASTVPLGKGLFRLQNVTDLGLPLDTLDGRKVEARGILVRQQNGDRINVTALKAVGPACEP